MKFVVHALLLIASMGITTNTRADDILCERMPTAEIVGKVKSDNKELENPCSMANAKIQAITYECGNVQDTYRKTQEFFRSDIKAAKDKCDDYCKEVSPKCRGTLRTGPECGLSIPTTKALAVGREVAKCPKHCKGQAFTYCSLYHANFFSYDSDQFVKEAPNCFCEKR